MKKLSVVLVLAASLASTSALANGGNNQEPPQSNFAAQIEEGPGTSIFDYFRRFFG